MKYSLLTCFSLTIFLLSSCKNNDINLPLNTPICIQMIIGNLQENDIVPDCLAAVKRYSFEGNFVYEIQEDACLDGPTVILNESCDTICSFGGFVGMWVCGASTNFYEDAELTEVIWEEVN